MIVKIKVYSYEEEQFLKSLVDELRNKHLLTIEEDVFGIKLELNVNSFDEVICLLEKYARKIDIELSIWATDNVSLYISKRETCSLGNQVE